MSDPFVAEVRIFPFNFAPKGWAWCDNQLLPISQNTALFSLLGTTYGGDGKSTFALPGFEGSAVVDAGQGPGLSQYFEGQVGGTETVTLLQSEIPGHAHTVRAATDPATAQVPDPTMVWTRSQPGFGWGTGNSPLTQMAFQGIAPTGGDQPH